MLSYLADASVNSLCWNLKAKSEQNTKQSLLTVSELMTNMFTKPSTILPLCRLVLSGVCFRNQLQIDSLDPVVANVYTRDESSHCDKMIAETDKRCPRMRLALNFFYLRFAHRTTSFTRIEGCVSTLPQGEPPWKNRNRALHVDGVTRAPACLDLMALLRS